MKHGKHRYQTTLAVLLFPPFLAQTVIAAQAGNPCRTLVEQTASHEALIKTYGKTEVTIEPALAETETVEVTVLFPRNPRKRIEIQWSDQQHRSKPETVTVRSPSEQTVGGIKTGASLAEVERVNGGAFKLRGFGWDQGGITGDWMGGTLSWPQTACRLRVRFAADKSTPESVWREVVGDAEFLSSDQRMKAVNPTADEIIIEFTDGLAE